jgi:hypothetical protein
MLVRSGCLVDSSSADLTYSNEFRAFISKVRPRFRSLNKLQQALPELLGFLVGGEWSAPLPTRRTLAQFIAVCAQVRKQRLITATSAAGHPVTLMTDESKKSSFCESI